MSSNIEKSSLPGVNTNYLGLSELSPAVLSAEIKKEETRKEIIDYLGEKLRPLEDRELYEKACKDSEEFEFTSDVLEQIADKLKPFAQNGRPGHDMGHVFRDLLSASAITGGDEFVKSAKYKNEVIAGLLAGAFHDMAVSIMPRYTDREWEAGHAEVSAWLFDKVTEDILPPSIRDLSSYAIAAHTHLLKPLDIENPVNEESGKQRNPWNDEIYEEEGSPFGLAVHIARMADRLDNNGVTHFARHILATCDATEGGSNLSGEDFYEMNQAALDQLFVINIREQRTGPPTVLEHMKAFAGSNFGATPYSQKDHLFPFFEELMKKKVEQRRIFTEKVMNQESFKEIINEPEAWGKMKAYLSRVSMSPGLDDVLAIVEGLWQKLSIRDKNKWLRGIEYAESAYDETLKSVQVSISPEAKSLSEKIGNILLLK